MKEGDYPSGQPITQQDNHLMNVLNDIRQALQSIPISLDHTQEVSSPTVTGKKPDISRGM